MVSQIRIIRTSQFFVPPVNFPANALFMLFGAGQAGERGGYRTSAVLLRGGIGGRGGDYASYTGEGLVGKSVFISIGAGGSGGNLGVGGNTSLIVNGITRALAAGGGNSGTFGVATNPGGRGGDPRLLAGASPPGAVVDAPWGGGGGGCGGENGPGGDGGDQPVYLAASAVSDGWTVLAVPLPVGSFGNCVPADGVTNNSGMLSHSGGGAADGGFNGWGGGADAVEQSPSAVLLFAGNGGATVNPIFDRSIFQIVKGCAVLNRNTGALAPQATTLRTDPSVNAFGDKGYQFQASPTIGGLQPGSYFEGIDASLSTFDQAGPGVGAAQNGGVFFNASNAGLMFETNYNGFDGGAFGGGGAGGGAVWDFGGNSPAPFSFEGGAGGNGGAIIIWEEPGQSRTSRIITDLPRPHYWLGPRGGMILERNRTRQR